MLERLQQQLAFTNELEKLKPLIATIGPWTPIVLKILLSIVGRGRSWR